MDLLKLKNVKYEVDNNLILKDINLVLKKQEYLTVSGPSGSGKSTLALNIASLLTPTGGKIWFKDKLVYSLNPILYRRNVSYAAQNPTLFGKTVEDNLAFPYLIRNIPFDKKRALEVLKAVDLPVAFLSRSVGSLSGGQTQRVALLRNIMILPDILILDEVTSGLDEKSKQSVLKMIDYFNQKEHLTIINITHDQLILSLSKNYIIIEDGKIVKSKRNNNQTIIDK